MQKTFNRSTLYGEITAKIVADLERGIVPWVRPWGSQSPQTSLTLPLNALTKRNYSGINILLLWSALEERGFASPFWLTFKQALSLGRAVRKGETGTSVYFADKFIPEKERRKASEEGSDPTAIHFLKRYVVFNAEQCDGLPNELFVAREPLPECQTIPHAEALIAATGADFRVGGDRAFYVPSQDFICIPHQSTFTEQINFYRTAFHELGHWSGHPSRLARNLTTSFGTQDYAREELVAEMATAFVCASLGIVPTVRHSPAMRDRAWPLARSLNRRPQRMWRTRRHEVFWSVSDREEAAARSAAAGKKP